MANHNNHHIATILLLTGMLVIATFLTGCSAATKVASQAAVESPHLYWKDIDVTVTDIEKDHWFAGTNWYRVTIHVHSDEYNLDGEYTDKSSGASGCPASWNYEEGDTVKAEMYSWVLDSTGEVVRRTINKVY